MLKEGDKVPSFDLESDAGTRVSDRTLGGRPAVVYFYPRDLTPGCTREAIAFTKASKEFARLGAEVVGVSKDSIASHCKFRDAHDLGIRLLSDPDLSMHKAFGAYGEKTMYGKKVTGVIRSTFVIGPDGRVAKVFPNVKVDGHAEKVLAAVAELGDAPPRPATKTIPATPAAKARLRPPPPRAGKTMPATPAAKARGKAGGGKRAPAGRARGR